MAFTETFRCDICGKEKSEAFEDWWLAWTQALSPMPDAPPLPQLRYTPWDVLLSHDANVRHLCGSRCAQTLMGRWMASGE
ncbi:MAG TPA: hypothetical protein VHB45_03440 [Alloacidobacterium sp.]|nr:hypothetical protein [Alloacidobacterium sp.]